MQLNVPEMLRWAVYLFVAFIMLMTLVMVGLFFNFNDTPVCAKGSQLQLFTQCEPGRYKPIYDPRP